MDTLHLPEAGRHRRRYTPEFKAQLLDACQQPGVSITAIALANQINPNVVRRWLRDLRSAQTAPVKTDVACIEAISSPSVARASGLIANQGSDRAPHWVLAEKNAENKK